MKKVFVIMVIKEASFGKVSQEGYDSLKKAQDWIEHREGEPRQVTPYHYTSGGMIEGISYDYIDYMIYEVNII